VYYQQPAVEVQQVAQQQNDMPVIDISKTFDLEEWQEVREEARQQKTAQEKISSLEEDREKQDLLFNGHIKQLDNATTWEQKQATLKEMEEIQEEARQIRLEQMALEKISSLEEDREKQDLLFEEHIKQLDDAKNPEQQQVALKDVMSTVSNTASLAVTLLTAYYEYRRKHQADDDMLAKEHFTIEDQTHQVRELAKLRDDGYITPDEFEQKKKEFLGLTEDQRDAAARRTFLRRFFRKHDPPPDLPPS
jgi:hypothetical protein